MKEKIKNIRDFVTKTKDLSSVVSATLIGNAILAAYWFLSASLLGPEQFGELSYYIAIVQIASIVSLIGSGNTLIVHISKNIKINSTIMTITLISGLLLSIILTLILQNILVGIFIFGMISFILITSELLGEKNYVKYSKILISNRILIFTIGIPLFYFMGSDGIFLGYALSFYPFSFLLIHSIKKSKINFETLKPLFGFMINSYVFDLSKLLPFFADKIIIAPLFGFAMLGNYQLGIQFLLLLSTIPTMMYQYLLPIDSRGDSTSKLKIFTVILVFSLTLILIFIAPVIIPIIYPQYHDASLLVQITSIAAIPISINLMFTSKFLGQKRNKLVIIGSTIAIVLQILLIYSLGEIFGIIGASLAIIMAQSLQSIFFTVVNFLKK